MTKDDFTNGWWDVPAGLPLWICPECKTGTWSMRWTECRPYCGDCGDHDGRRCPECGAEFDHVWGDEAIRKATLDMPEDDDV